MTRRPRPAVRSGCQPSERPAGRQRHGVRTLRRLTMLKMKKIGVLMGGLSAEREVSIKSGEAVYAALSERGWDAYRVFVDRDVDLVLRQLRIDVAFLALHGRFGEDGCIQGLLEMMGIPYTGSGVLASAIGMDKIACKRVWQSVGLPTPEWRPVDPGETIGAAFALPAKLPLVVKPGAEGS